MESLFFEKTATGVRFTLHVLQNTQTSGLCVSQETLMCNRGGLRVNVEPKNQGQQSALSKSLVLCYSCHLFHALLLFASVPYIVRFCETRPSEHKPQLLIGVLSGHFWGAPLALPVLQNE
jgi:hypothetical protein